MAVYSIEFTHSAVLTLIATLVLLLSSCSMPSPGSEATMAEATVMNASETDAKTTTLLAAAEVEIQNRNWLAANQLLKQGLAALGNSYLTPEMIDETGTKLLLADIEERKGSLETAALIRRRILGDRLSLLRAKSSKGH